MRRKNERETEYTDLAPIDDIRNGDEYLNALDWALTNKKSLGVRPHEVPIK